MQGTYHYACAFMDQMVIVLISQTVKHIFSQKEYYCQYMLLKFSYINLNESFYLLQVPSVSYKNLLQELAQKEGFPLPVYATTSVFSNHSAAFISTVEIQGTTFQGEPGNTKKQAEMNAAKVAFQHFKDSKSLRY